MKVSRSYGDSIVRDQARTLKLLMADSRRPSVRFPLLAWSHGTHCRWGTNGYMPPEVLRGEKYSTSVDLFALGVLLFILLGGYHPFDPTGDAPDMLVEQRIKTGEWNFDESAFKHVSAEARVVVAALLAPVPGQRPSPEELLEMSWVGGDAAPDKPLPNSHNQLRAFNDSRRAWRVAIAALEFFALVPCIEAEGDATSALSGHSTAQALIVQPMTNSSPISHTSGIAIDPGFSEEALAELRTSFDTFDEDRSGAISSEELLDRFLELGATEAEASAVLARVDSHHTGDISFDEFVAVVGPMMRERGRIALQRAFEQLDRDHSGSIDRSELIEMLAKLGLPNDGRTVDEMMRAADVDGDGVIR